MKRGLVVPVVVQSGRNVDYDAARLLQAVKSSFAHVERAQKVNVQHSFEGIEAKILRRAKEVTCNHMRKQRNLNRLGNIATQLKHGAPHQQRS